jgi:hypothetical protein
LSAFITTTEYIAEGRRKKEEGRRKKEEGSSAITLQD